MRSTIATCVLFACVACLPAAVEVIRPSEAYGLLSHCRRHAATRPPPFSFEAEVILRTGHLINVDGKYDGSAITLVPHPTGAQQLGAGDMIEPGVFVFDTLVIHLTTDRTGIAEMIGTGAAGTTRIAFRAGKLFERVADPHGVAKEYSYALADSEWYSIAHPPQPAGNEELLANPGGGGGGGGTGAPGAGGEGDPFAPTSDEVILPFAGLVSPTGP